MQVLLIDDDLDDQEIFVMSLNLISAAIHCVTANNGVDALKLFEDTVGYVPSFIFLDLNMPKMNGLECLKHLRRMDQLAKTRIYIYSTTSDKAVVENSRRLGATDFMVKPVSTVVLKKILTGLLKMN